MTDIINPYGMLEENMDEINLCWEGLVETGKDIYLSRLKVVVDQAEKRLNRLSPEERRIVGEIMDNRRKEMFDGSYIKDLRGFMDSFWDEYDPQGGTSKERYIQEKCKHKAMEKRMEEIKEDLTESRCGLERELGGLLGELFKRKD